jgi:hypothetical protein
MKIEKKHTFILLFCIFFVILLVFSLIFVNSKTKMQIIGFYDLEPKIIEAIKTSFDKNAPLFLSRKSQKYEYLIFDSDLPLETQLAKNKNVAVVFSYHGESQNSISEKASSVDKAVLEIMPTSMKRLSNNSYPILQNHLEMAVLNEINVTFKNNQIALLDKVLETAEKESQSGKFYALMTGIGNSDKVLSYFLSAMIESRYGVDELNKVNQFLSENQNEIDFSTLFDNEEVKSLKLVCDELASLKSAGLFHSQWDEMAFVDVQNFMEAKKISFVFMDLYSHREIGYGIIKGYLESFFPSGRIEGYPAGRSLIVPTVVATCFETSNTVGSNDCKKIVENMLTLKEQERLARDSGLGPVASSADTQDRQAYNVRLWAASADSIALDLGGAFTNPEARKVFFEKLRNIL